MLSTYYWYCDKRHIHMHTNRYSEESLQILMSLSQRCWDAQWISFLTCYNKHKLFLQSGKGSKIFLLLKKNKATVFPWLLYAYMRERKRPLELYSPLEETPGHEVRTEGKFVLCESHACYLSLLRDCVNQKCKHRQQSLKFLNNTQKWATAPRTVCDSTTVAARVANLPGVLENTMKDSFALFINLFFTIYL